MTTSHYIDTPRGLFHCLRTGEGRELFFCHGNSMSAGTYLPFLEELADLGFSITAPDIRGHGRSTKEKAVSAQSWDIFLEDLRQLAVQTANPPLIGVGHSMGGFFVYAAAALFPELFSRIVLLDPIILPYPTLVMAALGRRFGLGHKHPLAGAALRKKSEFESPEAALSHYTGKGMFRSWQPEFVNAYVEWSVEQDTTDTWTLCCAPEVEALMYTLVPLNSWAHAAKITIPALVVRGEHSEMFAAASGKKLAARMSQCRFDTLKGQGHFFPMENPAATVRAIGPFLKEAGM